MGLTRNQIKSVGGVTLHESHNGTIRLQDLEVRLCNSPKSWIALIRRTLSFSTSPQTRHAGIIEALRITWNRPYIIFQVVNCIRRDYLPKVLLRLAFTTPGNERAPNKNVRDYIRDEMIAQLLPNFILRSIIAHASLPFFSVTYTGKTATLPELPRSAALSQTTPLGRHPTGRSGNDPRLANSFVFAAGFLPRTLPVGPAGCRHFGFDLRSTSGLRQGVLRAGNSFRPRRRRRRHRLGP